MIVMVRILPLVRLNYRWAIGQNPETAAGPRGGEQANNVKSWLGYARRGGYATVDVLSAFESRGDYSALLDAIGVHPTPEGSTIWKDAVVATLTAP